MNEKIDVMNEECNMMEDMIIKYINGQLNNSDKVILFNHISCCSKCMKEFISSLKLSKMVSDMESEVPEDVKEFSFSGIYDVQDKEIDEKSNAWKLFDSLHYARKVVNDSILIANKSMKLGLQMI